ncbi:hypothetical protein PHJA_000108000 [Phtheirospermum japonicum]|uniref:Uncharacterized protein n=1 Tax=Phtheirospermum japonicum TaxID=374723 RepID=A0A830B6A4_9LAMI|nr:hypothetical protein PHJA_000108000 [Phtheirospermum japonicum]
MGLTWKEEHLDFVLVPSGLLIMLGYHLLHLRKCLNCPETTAIGFENYNRRAWVARILQVEAKERGQAISVISSNLSAATSFASISLTLSSLIGAWIGSSYQSDYIASTIYGNTTPTIVYVKYISLLACFLIAFACFVQTARCFVHANFLISMPNCEMPVENVESAVIRGSNFWVVGLRSLYFATNLLLWIFGPVPMFVSSVVTVVLLQYVDKNATPLPQYNKNNNNNNNKPPVKYEKSDKEMSEIVAKTSPNGTEPKSSPNGNSNFR